MCKPNLCEYFVSIHVQHKICGIRDASSSGCILSKTITDVFKKIWRKKLVLKICRGKCFSIVFRTFSEFCWKVLGVGVGRVMSTKNNIKTCVPQRKHNWESLSLFCFSVAFFCLLRIKQTKFSFEKYPYKVIVIECLNLIMCCFCW